MRRYRRMPVLATGKPVKAYWDDWADEDGHTPSLTVYEPADDWMTTGILDEHGIPMQAWVGTDPIGFLWKDEE